MPIKEHAVDSENAQTIERVLHARRYSLILDKRLCKGCEICSVICPREAITATKNKKVQGQKTKPPTIEINAQKCSYCGMCEPICPFGAIQVRVNNEHVVPVIEKGSFPKLIREIEADPSKCTPGCADCEKACPLSLIRVTTLLTPREQEPKIEDAEAKTQKSKSKVVININKDQCPGCRLCEVKCPEDAVHVRKIMHGTLTINAEKCPQGCQDCLDICPIPSALFLDAGKVEPNETFCIFCGACKIVCPVEGALKMDRKSIHHTPVSSGAWNTALEKLTSTSEYSKEAKAKGSIKIQKVVEKRLVLAKEAQA